MASEQVRGAPCGKDEDLWNASLAREHRLERRRLWYRRINLAFTRLIIDAIHSGSLVTARTQHDPVFGLNAVAECRNVPGEILIPRTAWTDKLAYEAAAKKLAELFQDNFKPYEKSVSAEVRHAGAAA